MSASERCDDRPHAQAAWDGEAGPSLLAAALEAEHRRWQEQLDRRLAQTTSPTARVLAVFDAYIDADLPAEPTGRALLGIGSDTCEHPAMRPVVRAHHHQAAELLEAQVRATGVDDPEALAAHLGMLLQGGLTASILTGDRARLEAARTLAAGVLGTASDARPEAD
ncbi:hypothetical protein ER308_06930 [Egibacter rhizosphaerae]|uniref:TetR/AcrR family transcriptional regulator n=1 Tax=Egibacter rhizosphaerae TaxID=1670831 RepID=A0A411YDN8_9ACTN|nr:hypothetical protein [Egibacter rhizosphaerae]QBI19300.1 hypothetical protein ER308_06930 [Egibacter rhizosphaerae]